MNDTPDNIVSALFLFAAAMWQLLAIIVAMIIGYVLLNMAFGHGVEAWRDAIRRRRAAKRPDIESELDS